MTKDRKLKENARNLAQRQGISYTSARRLLSEDLGGLGIEITPLPDLREDFPDYCTVIRCQGCSEELDLSNAKLFCSDNCRELASTVRYARKAAERGVISRADIKEAITIRLGFALVGGYPAAERKLAQSVRDAVIARDAGMCVQCGKPGNEIDHINGSSPDLANLQLLCHDCHVAKTRAAMRPATPAERRNLEQIWTTRIAPAVPLYLCDDHTRWEKEWRGLTRLRDEYLEARLVQAGYSRDDFPRTSWDEIWDLVAEDGAQDDPEAAEYLYEVMQRDD